MIADFRKVRKFGIRMPIQENWIRKAASISWSKISNLESESMSHFTYWLSHYSGAILPGYLWSSECDSRDLQFGIVDLEFGIPHPRTPSGASVKATFWLHFLSCFWTLSSDFRAPDLQFGLFGVADAEHRMPVQEMWVQAKGFRVRVCDNYLFSLSLKCRICSYL